MRVSSMLFDVWDTGQKTRVYLFDTGHTFNDQFIVVPPMSVRQEEVIRLVTAAHGWDLIKQAVKAKGWILYTDTGTPFDNDREKIGLDFLRIHDASYLLYGASVGSNNDPTTALMKPKQGGKLATVCIFQEVQAHF